jgi:hypothetical protein
MSIPRGPGNRQRRETGAYWCERERSRRRRIRCRTAGNQRSPICRAFVLASMCARSVMRARGADCAASVCAVVRQRARVRGLGLCVRRVGSLRTWGRVSSYVAGLFVRGVGSSDPTSDSNQFEFSASFARDRVRLKSGLRRGIHQSPRRKQQRSSVRRTSCGRAELAINSSREIHS